MTRAEGQLLSGEPTLAIECLERYVTRLGLDAAKRLLLTAENVDADTLLRIGFLTDLIAAGELAAGVDALTRVLAAMAPQALLSTKNSTAMG